MLSKVLTVSTLVVTAMSQQTSGNVGIAMSMTKDVILQAKDVYAQELIKHLAYIPLPDYDDPHSKDYAHDNYFSMTQDVAGEIAMTWEPIKNGFHLTMNKLNGVVYTGDYLYHIGPGMNAKGHAEVIMKTINLGLGLSFTDQVLPDGRTVPAVTSYDILVDINRDDIDIKIWGNLWADMAAACEIFFKSTVVHAIQDTMTVILTTGVPTAINYGFAYTDGQSNLYMHPTWILDWETPVAAIVTDQALEAGIEGNFWDSVYGEQYPTDSIPVMPYRIDGKTAGFQMYVSDFTVDSLFNSMLEEETVGGWFLYTEVPPTAGWQMTTGFLNKFLPGLSSTYGPD